MIAILVPGLEWASAGSAKVSIFRPTLHPLVLLVRSLVPWENPS